MTLGPLNHHEFPRVDIECTCNLCSDWREKRVEYETIRKFVYNHSKSCFCWKCCKCRELQLKYLAAQNKRDVYCELSWHFSKHPAGPRFMGWLENELLTSEETDGWWSKTAPIYSLSHWVYLFKESLAAAVTGVSGVAA
jgi:hypothetical protein